jgi:cytochrome oxidase assembly protein ShyY1
VRYLTPRLLGIHLLALVCVGIAASFGAWQYDAWQVRRDAERMHLTHTKPIDLRAAFGPTDRFPGDRVGQPVKVSGTWWPEATVYISDRETGGGQVGYWVVTPLTHGDADDPAIPIVRGWISDLAAAPEPPTGTAELIGWLQPSEAAGGRDDDPSDNVYPHLRTADLIQRTDGRLYAGYVVLDPERALHGGDGDLGNAGLDEATLDQLPPVGTFTAMRNFLYFVEWFVFAAFAALIWWRNLRATLATDHPAAVATGSPGEGEEANGDDDAAPQPVER